MPQVPTASQYRPNISRQDIANANIDNENPMLTQCGLNADANIADGKLSRANIFMLSGLFPLVLSINKTVFEVIGYYIPNE